MSNLPQPNFDETVAFLVNYAGDEPVVLTAIAPDGGGVLSRTFRALSQGEDIRTWLEAMQGRANLYFTVNPCIGALNGRGAKAKKTDIRALKALHVDIDPRVGEDFTAERERAVRVLQEFDPPASIIIDSGNGFQGFWLLEDEQPVGGQEERAVKLERYSQHIALKLTADNCHNIDRVMRLPGTINLPNATKRKKGRVPVLASLRSADWSARYPLSRFKAMPGKAVASSAIARPVKAPNPASTEPVSTDLALLPRTVSDQCKVIIVQGCDPDNPDRLSSRSEWLFRVCCELARCGVDEETIAAIITNPDYAISAHVLEKPKPGEYAARQARRALDEVGDDPVSFVNRNYFAVAEGRRAQFYYEEADGVLTPLMVEAFEFALAPYIYVDQEGGKKPYSKIWRESLRRRFYRRGFTLDPTEGNDRDTYNLWKGFGVEPRAGDWSLMRGHILEVLADGNADYADYIVKFAAWCVQNPADPPRVALVFKGGEGVGKGTFCNALVRIFGVHGLRVQSMTHVSGRFNAHMRYCCLLFADEAVVPNADGVGILKGLITEPTIPIEAKGVDVVSVPNHLHVVMASNNEWVVPASADARRFAVFAVSDKRKGDAVYFRALAAEIENGGLAAMLHDLLAMPLTGWHPETARPNTKELSRQKVNSLDPVSLTLFDCLDQGAMPGAELLKDGSIFLPTRALTEEARRRSRRPDITDNAVADLLGHPVRGLGFEKRRNRRPSGYILPPLPEARARWDKLRFPVDWQEPSEWDTGPTYTDGRHGPF